MVIGVRCLPMVVCGSFSDVGVCAGRCVVIGVQCLPMVVCGSFGDDGRVQCCFTSTETVRTITVLGYVLEDGYLG